MYVFLNICVSHLLSGHAVNGEDIAATEKIVETAPEALCVCVPVRVCIFVLNFCVSDFL